MTAQSGSARILAALRSRPHSADELYRLHAIVHSRVAELRRRGFVITCERITGARGASAYLYTLVSEPARLEQPQERAA